MPDWQATSVVSTISNCRIRLPMATLLPGVSVSRSTRLPSTNVPLVEPRSTTSKSSVPGAARRMTAWRRDTRDSGMTMSAPAVRPTTVSSLVRLCRPPISSPSWRMIAGIRRAPAGSGGRTSACANTSVMSSKSLSDRGPVTGEASHYRVSVGGPQNFNRAGR